MLLFLFLGCDENRTAHNHNPNRQLKMRDQMTFWDQLIMGDHFRFWNQLNLLETEQVLMIEVGAKKSKAFVQIFLKRNGQVLRQIIMK